MAQATEKTVITIGKKVLTLEIRDFGSGDINIEDLLQVQMNDILEDVITFPVIFNRIGVYKAEVDAILREVTLDNKIFQAQLYQKHKNALLGTGAKATEAQVEAAVTTDPQYKVKMQQVHRVQKEADIMDALYWSAKSKDQKLNAISVKLKPEEFEKEILEGVINSVMIKTSKNLFPKGR